MIQGFLEAAPDAEAPASPAEQKASREKTCSLRPRLSVSGRCPLDPNGNVSECLAPGSGEPASIVSCSKKHWQVTHESDQEGHLERLF